MTTTYRGLFVYLCIFDGYYSEDRVEKKKKQPHLHLHCKLELRQRWWGTVETEKRFPEVNSQLATSVL